MNADKKEVIELLLANRSFLYSLFHKVISADPCAELMDVLLAEHTSQAFAMLSAEEGDVLSRVPKFLDEIRGDMSTDSDFISKLRSEYTRLFVGPLSLVAPPWESVYYGDDGMLFQESTLKVREFYRSFGLLPEGYPHVADDSLALELAFMTELAKRSADAFAADDTDALKHNLEGSAAFLREHLLVWIPYFLKKMADSTTDYMYPQICLILESFIKADYAVIKEILEVF